jgi:pimeloyl-ACP methyl ester carboxylesterase
METQNKHKTYYRTVEVDGLDIFYREAGPVDEKTILLLHGFPTSSHMFRDLMQILSGQFHLVAPDFPGFGNSSMPGVEEWDYTFDHIAAVVDNFSPRGVSHSSQASGKNRVADYPKRQCV